MFSNSDIIPPLTNQIHTFPEHVLQFIRAQKKTQRAQWAVTVTFVPLKTLQQTLVPPLWILQPRQICINKKQYCLEIFIFHDVLQCHDYSHTIMLWKYLWNTLYEVVQGSNMAKYSRLRKHVKYFDIVNCTISQYCQSYNIAKLSIVQYCVFQTKCWTINNWHQLHLKQCIYFKTNEAAEYFNSSGSIILIFVLKDISEP